MGPVGLVQRLRSSRLAALSAVLSLASLASSGSALAADPERKDPPKEEERAPAERLAGVKSRVFELKHRSPDDLMGILRPLASGVKGTGLAASNSVKLITVRDFPENIAIIDETLRRLDVPMPARPDVELKLRLLIGVPNGVGQVAPELEGVVKQLRATLHYKGYYQVSAISQRVRAGSSGSGRGVAETTPPVSNERSSIDFKYGFENVDVTAATASSPATVVIRKLRFEGDHKVLGDADISTGLSLRENERVVVGTASLTDRAMVLVLSARIIK